MLACTLASEHVLHAKVQTKVSFAVSVTDNGEPGTNDFFSIQLSNGYSGAVIR